jgi:hypothetical protein
MFAGSSSDRVRLFPQRAPVDLFSQRPDQTPCRALSLKGWTIGDLMVQPMGAESMPEILKNQNSFTIIVFLTGYVVCSISNCACRPTCQSRTASRLMHATNAIFFFLGFF